MKQERYSYQQSNNQLNPLQMATKELFKYKMKAKDASTSKIPPCIIFGKLSKNCESKYTIYKTTKK